MSELFGNGQKADPFPGSRETKQSSSAAMSAKGMLQALYNSLSELQQVSTSACISPIVDAISDVLVAMDKPSSAVNAESGKPGIVDWVNCPICGEPDMRKTTTPEGFSLIFCVNHGCASNGGSVARSSAENAEDPRVIDFDRRYAEHILADFGTFEEGIDDQAKLAQWIRNIRVDLARDVKPQLTKEPIAWVITWNMKQSGPQASAYVKERDARDAARNIETYAHATNVVVQPAYAVPRPER